MGISAKIPSTIARAWMRENFQKIVRDYSSLIGAECAVLTKPNNALLKRMLRDPKVPKPVKKHIYTWLAYRRRRGHAN
jgi:hypothetical protein